MEGNKLIVGDCIEEMKKLPENSVDSIVTDPPYGLEFMGKEWDKLAVLHKLEGETKQKRFEKITLPRFGHNGTLQQEWHYQWAKEALRILKPGGFLLSFGGTRTYHRMACAIEDAGFEIRDCIQWIYGSGFPKSLNIGKQVDKIQGNNREVVGLKSTYRKPQTTDMGWKCEKREKYESKGNSQWEGWGTALKPANEPIVVARKPLSEKNVALNVLKWGTAGINIDACRIGTKDNLNGGAYSGEGKMKHIADHKWGFRKRDGQYVQPQGRFPANIILDEEAGRMLDAQSETAKGWGKSTEGYAKGEGSLFKQGGVNPNRYDMGGGGASRFFYCAKASKAERNMGCEGLEDKEAKTTQGLNAPDMRENRGRTAKETVRANNHPTVKPIKLMRYLVRLVTPPNGVVLDPFLGSGTTAMAAKMEGFNWLGIEREAEYVKIAEARIKAVQVQRRLV